MNKKFGYQVGNNKKVLQVKFRRAFDNILPSGYAEPDTLIIQIYEFFFFK